jgi:hypothetical protein
VISRVMTSVRMIGWWLSTNSKRVTLVGRSRSIRSRIVVFMLKTPSL